MQQPLCVPVSTHKAFDFDLLTQIMVGLLKTPPTLALFLTIYVLLSSIRVLCTNNAEWFHLVPMYFVSFSRQIDAKNILKML